MNVDTKASMSSQREPFINGDTKKRPRYGIVAESNTRLVNLNELNRAVGEHVVQGNRAAAVVLANFNLVTRLAVHIDLLIECINERRVRSKLSRGGGLQCIDSRVGAGNLCRCTA